MLPTITGLITEVMEEAGRMPGAPITEKTSLRNDLGFDSLELAVLTVRIQSEFGVDIFEKGTVDTVSDILGKLPARENGACK